MNYMVYPTKVLLISQSYKDTYSHNKNYLGVPKDYPIDETSGDSNRSYFYTPCDEVEVKKIWGVGVNGTNTIWLQSTSPVVTPTFTDYVTIMILHPNDDTLKGIKVGDKFKRGEPIFLEGNDGNATGYHFHISVSRGKYVAPGWSQNSLNGSVITGIPQKPEDVFFVDKDITKVLDTRGLNFKYLIKEYGVPVDRDPYLDQLEITGTIKLYDLNNKELGILNKGIYNFTKENKDLYKVEYEKEKYGYIKVEDSNMILLYYKIVSDIEEKTEIKIPRKNIYNIIIKVIKKILNIIRRIFVK